MASGALRDFKGRHQHSAETPPSALDTNEFKFDRVEVDALVLMKIIKHASDEGIEQATGSLVGLIHNNVLEVTNCFVLSPLQSGKAFGPSAGSGTRYDVDMEQYQLAMVNFFRDAYLDYMQVGFYQSIVSNNTSNTEYLTAMYEYHSRESANIAMFYDPGKSSNGFPNFRVLRLTRRAREAGPLYEMAPEKIASQHIIFNQLFEELPMTIKKSPLTALYLDQIGGSDNPSSGSHLIANTPFVLERGLSELYSHLDQYVNECQALGQYSKNLRTYNQQKEQLLQQRVKENEVRRQRGEPPLPEDIQGILPQQFPTPDRKKSFLCANDAVKACEDMQQMLIRSFIKLFTLQEGLSKSC